MASMDHDRDEPPAWDDAVVAEPFDASSPDDVAARLGADDTSERSPIRRPIHRPIHEGLPTSPGWTKPMPRPEFFPTEPRADSWSPASPTPPPPPSPAPGATGVGKASNPATGVDRMSGRTRTSQGWDDPVEATTPVDRFHPGGLLLAPTRVLPSTQAESASSDASRSLLDDGQRLSFLDAMPVAAFLIDHTGNIVYLNRRAAAMVGEETVDVLGRSVLDYVSVDDLDFAAELLMTGNDYVDELLGPSRIRYVDASGHAHWTQVWAQVTPPEVGVDGFIVTLTKESVRDVLVTAVASVASDDPLELTLGAIAESTRGLPIVGRGAILVVEPTDHDERVFRLIGDWPIGEESINASGTPWHRAMTSGVNVDIDDVEASDLSPAARSLLTESGVRSLIVRPIFSGLEIAGVLVVFRSEARAATANQNDHLGDAIRLAGLAFAQTRRRLELEQAAHRDALTRVANRAAFNDRLRTERRAIDVLFVDLDHFKSVNDTFGHDVGDRVLTEAASRIESTIRQDDTVYRTGGDEFIVLCEATGDDPKDRVTLAERIVELLVTPFVIDNHRVRIGATIGIAAAAERSLFDTVKAADAALYRAKERGRAGWAHD